MPNDTTQNLPQAQTSTYGEGVAEDVADAVTEPEPEMIRAARELGRLGAAHPSLMDLLRRQGEPVLRAYLLARCESCLG